ncbi:MAG: hypothetical protein EBE86_022450 [Hormoscilla sp. GUM202]|nr:hypothetical protein [Hormoscilla sp. GUM202]
MLWPEQICFAAEQICFGPEQICFATGQICFASEQIIYDLTRLYWRLERTKGGFTSRHKAMGLTGKADACAIFADRQISLVWWQSLQSQG